MSCSLEKDTDQVAAKQALNNQKGWYKPGF